jgi:VWFA-related protein
MRKGPFVPAASPDRGRNGYLGPMPGRSRIAIAAAAALLPVAAPASAQQPSPTPVQEIVFVTRVEVTLHVTDKLGHVIPGLGKEDFRLFVDEEPVPIESVEWAGAPAAAPAAGSETPPAEARPAPDAAFSSEVGRLLVFVFQNQIEGVKDEGLLRMKRQALDFVDTLTPRDRAAVLLMGSRLWLNQDFTVDRKALRAAISRVPQKEDAAAAASDSGEPSLAPRLPAETTRAATSPEKALAAIGRALRPLPGSKAVLFFGWAIGRWNALAPVGDYHMGRIDYSKDYEDARRALSEAQAPVFTLDVSSGPHQLQEGLNALSFETGGFYMPTYQFPRSAMQQVGEAIKGHYVLVFRKPDLPRGPHKIRIDRMRGNWNLLYRQDYDDGS